MAIRHITEENFNELLQSEKPILIDFWASWCGPCQMIAPVIEQIAQENPRLTVAKVNVDDAPALAMRFGVESIPTLVAMRDGQVTDTLVGLRSAAQILAMNGLSD